MVTTGSITPTILDFCGIEYDHNSLSEKSVAELCKGSTASFEEAPVFSTGVATFEDRASVRWKDKSYIKKLVTGAEEVYDLSNDPGEQISLTRSNTEDLDTGRTLIEQNEKTAARIRAQYGIRNPVIGNMDSDRQEELRALGYIH